LNREVVGARVIRPEKARRRRLRGGGALGGPCSPAGLLGSARGGPRRLGHARAAAAAAATGASTATVAVCDGEHERDVKEMAAKLRAVLVGSEETGSGGNGSGGMSFATASMAAPFRSARSTRERGKESGEASECSGSSGVRIWRRRGRAARGAEVGRAAAMECALCCMAATETKQRTRGVRLCARLGVRFWAISAPNWAMGLEAKLFSF